MRVTLIAAVASNGVIGADGDIPWRIPEDWRRFKSLTLGHTLVMGRKTYDSIGRPLPGRTTIVITRQPSWRADGITVVHTLEEALQAAPEGEVFIAGGGDIYRLALPLADRMSLTEVDQSPEGNAFFPEWDSAQWRQTARIEHPGFAFVDYARASS